MTASSSPRPRFGVGSLVSHIAQGVGRILGYEEDCYIVLFKGGMVTRVPFAFDGMSAMEAVGDPQLDLIKQAVREVLQDYGWLEADLEMGKRWQGGVLRLIPGREETQPKEIPLEQFFSKIIGIREKLRVLEQKINNHPKLSDEEKLELQGYITRCCGSLTTFNVLFADKPSHFVGQKGGA